MSGLLQQHKVTFFSVFTRCSCFSGCPPSPSPAQVCSCVSDPQWAFCPPASTSQAEAMFGFIKSEILGSSQHTKCAQTCHLGRRRRTAGLAKLLSFNPIEKRKSESNGNLVGVQPFSKPDITEGSWRKKSWASFGP